MASYVEWRHRRPISVTTLALLCGNELVQLVRLLLLYELSCAYYLCTRYRDPSANSSIWIGNSAGRLLLVDAEMAAKKPSSMSLP